LKQDNSSGYAALRHGAGLIERRDVGRIALTGADRRSYLQGLLTNDIELLTPGTGCYAAMLTAQGRMMTDMRVLELGDSVLLDVPLPLTAAIRDHLERFVFSEDVQVQDVTSARAAVGIYGPRALDVLMAAGMDGDVPFPLFGSTRVRIAGVAVAIVRSDDAGVAGYEALLPVAESGVLVAALLAAGAVAVDAGAAEAVRIESGRPRFGADMDTDTIPLEAGIEARAISRSKGCYVGQEVIVRVQDRGHGRVAKRLSGLVLDAGAPAPVPGTLIRSGDREVGHVTSAAWSPALGRPIALGYVHRDFVEPGTPLGVAGVMAAVAVTPFVP
jgi:folate-binding protein YgfZ